MLSTFFALIAMLSFIAAEEIEKGIAGLFKLDPALVAKFKDVLYN